MFCTVVFYLVSPGDLLVFHQESAAVNSPPPPPPPPPSPPPPPGSVSSPLPVQSTQRSQNLQDSSGDSPVPSGSRGVPLPERHLEAVEVLRDLSRLRERFRRLGPRVAALEEGRVEERAERRRLQELVSSRGSQEPSSDVMEQLRQQRTLLQGLSSQRDENQRLQSDLQKTFLQLRAECEKQDGSCRRLQRHIEELFKATEELQDKKVDKLTVQTERAPPTSPEGRVSRLQSQSATEQLSAAVQQLRDQLSVQEQDWQRAVHKLTAELDCKLSSTELEPLRKQLDGRWRSIAERLQAQEAAELDDAAVLRKQLVDRFHCLSCDRPVVKYSTEQHLVTLPSTPGFPAHRSIRPFTVYALEQFRQHYRSERMSGLTDYGHFNVSRNCGGSHTVNPTNQRRHATARPCTHGEVDVVIQSEEVDIVGLDGHIYKGRLNTPVVRNPENRLPTISAKEGLWKSRPSRPVTSPEVGSGSQLQQHLHQHNAKNGQCSRSASSSGRDWAVPTPGCTSHNFVTQDAAEHRADTPFDH
ncbi:glutamine-rich protein 2-like isoform X2 [Nelusetta ayraudi]|uniref:glutamine-rich protein 2-like isoform X2 n=1 Tax=Nelusetta ayraudi TaxID=303726 RepID=UPI003F6E8A4F